MSVQDRTTVQELRTTAGLTVLITGLFQEALNNEGLDECADFFESGGDSLTAFQITGRLQEAVGAEVAVALVFAYPTPAELAEIVAEELTEVPAGVAHE
ncbi:acyl carrier protein [Streptomyces atroolivaceus]|uniref:Acyl carrier protein n=1 Tax=Streptomyces atroolivaceus TaxID=66869 RepID=A0ABV9VLE9_STRAZ|nr:acyl carrier protein [Streptomyces atroolivaceus]